MYRMAQMTSIKTLIYVIDVKQKLIQNMFANVVHHAGAIGSIMTTMPDIRSVFNELDVYSFLIWHDMAGSIATSFGRTSSDSSSSDSVEERQTVEVQEKATTNTLCSVPSPKRGF